MILDYVKFKNFPLTAEIPLFLVHGNPRNISNEIEPGSPIEKQVINHEMRHSTDMKIGKLAYGDDFVQWNGNIYPRKTINGKDMIIVDGVAKEAGDGGFPWEKEANNGNAYG